ncbi:MAG TPA: site-specific integrase [Schlesneria sp.]
MASLEQQARGGNYRVIFWFDGRKFSRTLKTSDDQEANAAVQRIEENIRLVERGRLEIPADADVATFLLSDGKLDKKPVLTTTLKLDDLLTNYRQQLPEDSMEANTLCTMEIHLKHLRRIIPPKLVVNSITQTHLQQYVEKRSGEKGRRGNGVSAVTIKKELATLRAIWNWGRRNGDVTTVFPMHGLKFPKTTEKPAFQTFAEIEAQIARGGLTESEQAELWDSLFLTVTEQKEVLKFIREKTFHPYLYPMLVFTAHTGARRSEMLRARVTDIDFKSNTAVLREKKRVRGMRTTRRVPLSEENRKVLQTCLKNHPGGQSLFCRSHAEPDCVGQPLTVDEVHRDLKAVLSGSKWAKIRGLHVFRHSFASNCAAKAVDQRMIDGWMGHQTEEMRKRYRHLLPTQQREAINTVFN